MKPQLKVFSVSFLSWFVLLSVYRIVGFLIAYQMATTALPLNGLANCPSTSVQMGLWNTITDLIIALVLTILSFAIQKTSVYAVERFAEPKPV